MSKKKKYLALLALALSGGSIYLLPFIKYVFYDQMMGVMNITNTQMGVGLTMYGIGNVLLYIPGGILADKLSPRKSMFWSLLATAGLGIIFGMTLNYAVSNIIWLLLSISTVLVFWSALIKTVGLIGDEDEKGKMYGLYYAGNGLIGAIGNALALWIFSRFTDPETGMRMAIFIIAGINIVAAMAVFFFIEEKNKDEIKKTTSAEDKFDMSKVKELIKNPLVWMVSMVILCGYTIFTTTSFFTPYLTNVIGVSENLSSVIQIVRQNLFLLICAPLGGYIVDKIKSTSKWFTIGFSITGVLFLTVILAPIGVNIYLIVALTMITCAVSLMVYGVIFSVINECKFPVAVIGTVIGIASVIGYIPDFYMHSLCGKLLDVYGNAGYNYIFGILLGVCILGAILGVTITKRMKKQ